MRTRDEVEELKKSWAADPTWDIWDTEGFEDYGDELRQYAADMEAMWAQQALERERELQSRDYVTAAMRAASDGDFVAAQTFAAIAQAQALARLARKLDEFALLSGFTDGPIVHRYE